MKPKTVHPLLFAIFPILSILSANITEVEPSDAVIPAVISLIGAAVLFLILSLAFKDGRKGALAATLAIFLFFSYGHAGNILSGPDSVKIDAAAIGLLAVWAVILIAGIVGIARTKRDLSPANKILNAISIFILIVPAVTVAAYEAAHRSDAAASGPNARLDSDTLEAEAEYKPDIYYLIFDRYSNARELNRVLDFDNSKFIDDLKDRGFYVAGKSRANYPKTYLSLSSSLNMKYHARYFDRKATSKLLLDSRVLEFLKAQGYKCVHYESRYPPTRYNPYADINVATSKRQMNAFVRLVLDTTLVKPVLIESYPLEREEQTLYQLESLKKAPKIPGPKFVFAHVIVPHDPYLFDKNSRRVSEEALKNKPETELYTDYILFANTKIQEILDSITADQDNPPVVIIQADEGFRSKAAWRRKHPLARELHFGILNAYYLPGVDKEEALYDSISPVNSFRVVLNAYFHTDFKMLEDECYLPPQNKNQHSLKYYTDSLKD